MNAFLEGAVLYAAYGIGNVSNRERELFSYWIKPLKRITNVHGSIAHFHKIPLNKILLHSSTSAKECPSRGERRNPLNKAICCYITREFLTINIRIRCLYKAQLEGPHLFVALDLLGALFRKQRALATNDLLLENECLFALLVTSLFWMTANLLQTCCGLRCHNVASRRLAPGFLQTICNVQNKTSNSVIWSLQHPS